MLSDINCSFLFGSCASSFFYGAENHYLRENWHWNHELGKSSKTYFVFCVFMSKLQLPRRHGNKDTHMQARLTTSLSRTKTRMQQEEINLHAAVMQCAAMSPLSATVWAGKIIRGEKYETVALWVTMLTAREMQISVSGALWGHSCDV